VWAFALAGRYSCRRRGNNGHPSLSLAVKYAPPRFQVFEGGAAYTYTSVPSRVPETAEVTDESCMLEHRATLFEDAPALSADQQVAPTATKVSINTFVQYSSFFTCGLIEAREH